MDVAELIYLALGESEALEDLVGTRYGPALAQGTDRPYVRWDADGPAPVTQNGALRKVLIRFECVADTYTAAAEVADAIEEAVTFTDAIVGTGGVAVAGMVTARRSERQTPGDDDLGFVVSTIEALWWVTPTWA